MADRAELAAKTLEASITAIDAGLDGKADDILRRAVHAGLRPVEVVAAALAHDPVRLAVVARSVQEDVPMLVTYTGPEDEVTLAPVIGGARMRRGEPVELPDAVGRRLCDQPDFMPAGQAQPSEIERLRARAEGLGIEVDGRWGVSRLTAEIERTEADASEPAEEAPDVGRPDPGPGAEAVRP